MQRARADSWRFDFALFDIGRCFAALQRGNLRGIFPPVSPLHSLSLTLTPLRLCYSGGAAYTAAGVLWGVAFYRRFVGGLNHSDLRGYHFREVTKMVRVLCFFGGAGRFFYCFKILALIRRIFMIR